MTFYNLLGTVMILWGLYYTWHRGPEKYRPDVPPSVEVGVWRVEYYMEKDKTTIWRKVFKGGEPYRSDIVWLIGQGFINPRIPHPNELVQ